MGEPALQIITVIGGALALGLAIEIAIVLVWSWIEADRRNRR